MRLIPAHVAGVCLVLCSAVGSALMVQRELNDRRTASATASTPERSEIADAHAIAAGSTPLRVANRGPTIVVFTDYQCPACRALDRRLDSLWRSTAGAFGESLRHFPVRDDSVSPAAAAAGECAHEAGSLPELNRLLYLEEAPLTTVRVRELLAEATIPEKRAMTTACLDSGQKRNRVAHDLALARELKLVGTPAFIAHGRIYYGAYSMDSLRSILRLSDVSRP